MSLEVRYTCSNYQKRAGRLQQIEQLIHNNRVCQLSQVEELAQVLVYWKAEMKIDK
jgi:hypothetical protein